MTAMTFRLNDADHALLRAKAEAEGVSMQDLLHRALDAYLHRERVLEVGRRVIAVHADALEILGS